MSNVEEKHKKTVKIGSLVENKASWKARKQAMHRDNQKYMANKHKQRNEDVH